MSKLPSLVVESISINTLCYSYTETTAVKSEFYECNVLQESLDQVHSYSL